jgi:hypothetical protein
MNRQVHDRAQLTQRLLLQIGAEVGKELPIPEWVPERLAELLHELEARARERSLKPDQRSSRLPVQSRQ